MPRWIPLQDIVGRRLLDVHQSKDFEHSFDVAHAETFLEIEDLGFIRYWRFERDNRGNWEFLCIQTPELPPTIRADVFPSGSMYKGCRILDVIVVYAWQAHAFLLEGDQALIITDAFANVMAPVVKSIQTCDWTLLAAHRLSEFTSKDDIEQRDPT